MAMATDRQLVTGPTDLQSPILVLTDILREARNGESLVSIPSVITNTIRSRLRSSIPLPALEIQSMVSILDSSPSTLCARLGIDTFVVITAVLRASEPCLAQQRGFYLLTRSLEEDRRSSDLEAVAARKAAIGEKIISNLLRCFGHANNPLSLRRWIGLLAAELLQDCESNGHLVDVGPEDIRRALGQSVTGDKSPILQLVAGTMIRSMTSLGIPEESFWPTGADRRMFADFPKSQHHTSQWVVDFEEYLDGVFSQGLSDETSTSLFAQAMNIGNLKFSVRDEPAILVTVTEDLYIMVPSSETGPAVYVDVPLPNVADVEINKPGNGSQDITSQRPPAAVLKVHLSEQSNHTFYLNASEQRSLEIVLFLNNAEDATDIREWILAARATSRVSESQSLPLPYEPIHSLEAIANAAESHSMSTDGAIRALDQEYDIVSSPDVVTAVDEPTLLSQQGRLDSAPQPIRDNTGSTRTSLASTAVFIRTLDNQGGGQSRGTLSRVDRSVQQSSAPAAFTRQFDEFSDQGLTSSAQWTKGLKIIDNAPELQVNISESVELSRQLEVNGVTSITNIASGQEKRRPAVAVGSVTSKGSKTDHDRANDFENGGLSEAAEARLPLNGGMTGHGRAKGFDDGGSSGAAEAGVPLNGGKTDHGRAKGFDNGGSRGAAEARTYADDDDLDHDSLYDASPRGSTDNLRATPKQLMLDGNVDESRERLDKTDGQTKNPTAINENINTTSQHGRKIVQRMRNGNKNIAIPIESVPGAAKLKSTAFKKPGSRGKANTARAAARPTPDMSHEDEALFDIPESPDRLKNTRSAKGRVSKIRKASKPSAKPAVYSAKAAARASAGSSVKPQVKEVMRLPESREPQRAGNTNWDEGLNVDEDKHQLATKHKMAEFTLSKLTSSTKVRKRKNVGKHKSPITVKAGSPKNRKIAESKKAATKRQSSPLTLNMPKSRRAAAVKANNRIQGIHDDDDLDSATEPLQPRTAAAEPLSDIYADREAETDQAKLQTSGGSDLMEASTITEGLFRQIVRSETPVNNWTTGEFDDEASTAKNVASPKVHRTEATGLPEEVALLERPTKDTPLRTMDSGPPSKQAVSADSDSAEQETHKTTMSVEDLAHPIDHYFDDAMTASDEHIHHESDSIEKAVTVQEAGLLDEAHNKIPPAGPIREAHETELQKDPKEAFVKGKEPIAIKLKRALVGILDASLQTSELPETKGDLPQASAKFQPKMIEIAPNEEPKRTKEVRRTKLDKPLHAKDHDKKVKVYGKADRTDKRTLEYEAPENVTRSKVLEPTQLPRNSGNALGIVKSNTDRTKSQASEIINISSEDSGVSELFSDGDADDELPAAAAQGIPKLLPPTSVPAVVLPAESKYIVAEKTTAASKVTAGPKAAAAPGVAPVVRKRKARDQDDQTRLSKEPRVPLPTRLTTRPEEAGTDMAREGTLTPLTDDPLHRKTTLISFSARGPRNQGIVSARKPRVSMMTGNDVEKQENYQKEAAMKRKRDEDTLAAPRLVETPEEKRQRRSISASRTHERVTRGSIETNISRRLSAQGTRVDENGSPQPLARNRSRSDELVNGILKRLQALEESVIAPQQDTEDAVGRTKVGRLTVEETDLPTPSIGSPPVQGKDMFFPSIRKQLPSSPSAPSQSLNDFIAHRVQPGGKFVNVETESIVKSSAPQDPFTGVIRRRPSSFIERLRAQGKLAGNSTSDNIDGKDPTIPIRGVQTRPTHTTDPDKTVVAESMYHSSPSLRPDTSSESSESTEPSPHSKSSGRGIEHDAARQWRQALQPHQNSQLDILYDISDHLVRHLIDQETAVGDIIENYRRGGTRLIEDMERTHQKEYQQFEAEMKDARSDLVKMYTEIEKKLAQSVEAVKKSPVAKMEKQWRAEQDDIQSKLDAAFRACRE